MLRIARRSLAGLVGVALLASGAAEGQTCFTMQAEMMHLQARGGGGGTSDRNKYERAYREQSNVLASTERRARDAGCFGGGFILFRRQADRSCNALIGKIREMQDNLARLDNQRRRGARGSDDSYRMQELRGMMEGRGCDIPGGAAPRAPRGGTFIFEPDTQRSTGSGTYRTLCVRTCDGYYFPISFSTTSDRFAEDEQSCQAMCTGTESRLFYYPNPGGGPENMTSIAGEAYVSLPTAFQYRTQLDSACTCHPAGGYTTIAALAQGGVSLAPDPTAPRPRPRPGPGEDPETLANRLGDYVPSTPSANPEPAIASGPVVAGTDGSPIRIVGPAIGNDAQDALVLTPVPN